MRQFELVIPAYNESKSLSELVSRMAAGAIEANLDENKFQLVIVENGSTDDSANVLLNLSQSNLGKWFRVVTIPVNQGYGYGLKSGLDSTNAKVVAWTHADLQCDPADVFRGYSLLINSNAQNVLVKGVRIGRNWKDQFVSRVFELFAFVILGIRVFEMNAQPKIMQRDLLHKFTNPPKTFAFDLYALYQAHKNNYKIESFPVQFPPRLHGTSKWAATFFSRYKTILGMIKYMFKLSSAEGRL